MRVRAQVRVQVRVCARANHRQVAAALAAWQRWPGAMVGFPFGARGLTPKDNQPPGPPPPDLASVKGEERDDGAEVMPSPSYSSYSTTLLT
jgi:hypothetical protein